jgi:phosphoribosylformimino-5-aminoimidazole carboxamide ribonucleotide (ProFAR) isomerase
MILVIPSLDIKNGKAVQRIKSAKQFEFYYKELQNQPVELCQLWRSENAKTLHINDLDGDKPNSPNKDIILEIMKSLDIPITLASTSTSIDNCIEYLEKGIFRVSLCHYPLENIEGARNLIKDYSPSRIIFHLVAKNNKVVLMGEGTDYTIPDYIQVLKEIGAERLVYGDVEWTGGEQSVNFEKLENMINLWNNKLSLFCGVPNYSTLHKVTLYEKHNLDSIIISRPLYENCFPCQAIWRLAETY